MSNNEQPTEAPATVRVEVVGNRSIQADFFERIEKRGVGGHYTLFPEVQGAGHAGPRRGDHIWPEENFLYFAYVDEESARTIRDEVDALREQFEDEGVRFFATRSLDL
jgi:hypothetical protein